MNADAVISAMSGSALVAVLAKAFISKSFKELEDAVDKIMLIREELAKVTVKLENHEKLHDIVHKMDRKVAALESRVFLNTNLNKNKMNGGAYDDL